MRIQTLKPLLSFLRNKYIITTLAFIVWMLFFDPKDIGTIIGRSNKLKDLKSSERHLAKEIKGTKLELRQLETNAESIVKYARENFYMKKDNEDLFITNNK